MKTSLDVKLPFWEWRGGGILTRWLKKREWIIEGHGWEQEVRHQTGFISMARKSNRKREKEVKGPEPPHIAASTIAVHRQNPYQRSLRGPESAHPAGTDLCSAILMFWLAFMVSIQNVKCNFAFQVTCAEPFHRLVETEVRPSVCCCWRGRTEPGDAINRNIWLDDWLRIMGRLDDNRMSPSAKGRLNFKFPRLAGDWSKSEMRWDVFEKPGTVCDGEQKVQSDVLSDSPADFH